MERSVRDKGLRKIEPVGKIVMGVDGKNIFPIYRIEGKALVGGLKKKAFVGEVECFEWRYTASFGARCLLVERCGPVAGWWLASASG